MIELRVTGRITITKRSSSFGCPLKMISKAVPHAANSTWNISWKKKTRILAKKVQMHQTTTCMNHV